MRVATRRYDISESQASTSERAQSTMVSLFLLLALMLWSQVYTALERRYEERVGEVRVLEGQLADFNLAFDKVRTGAELGDVRHQQQRLAAANEHERRRLDEVFLRRADAEQRARTAELEIESIHRRNEQRMQSLVRCGVIFVCFVHICFVFSTQSLPRLLVTPAGRRLARRVCRSSARECAPCRRNSRQGAAVRSAR